MSANKWNFFYKKDETSVKENIVNAVSLWCAIGLLWWSFCAILSECFPQFLQVETLDAEGKTLVAGMDWLVCLLWLVVLWVSYDFPEKYLRKGMLLVRGLSLAIPIVYAMVNYGKITRGMIAILEIYFPYVNNYYQTGFYMQGGLQEAMPKASTFVMMVLWLLGWLFAYGLKKKILLAVFPAFALGLELAVGLSPVGGGLLAWFAAGFLLLVSGGTKLVFKVLVLAGALFSLAVSATLFGEQIRDLSTEEQKQAVLDWQADLMNFNLADLFVLDFHFSKEFLRNEAPLYSGKVIFEITADKRPENSIYLRGFYGTKYQNHAWNYDTTAFSKACAEAEIAESEMARELFNLTYEQADAYYKAQYSQVHLVNYKIAYVGMTGDVAYVPYASVYETLDDTYTFMGDYLLKKSIWDRNLEVKAVVPQQLDFEKLKMISMKIGEREYLESADSFSFTGSEQDLKWNEKLDWYNQLAFEYLQVPEDMEGISEAAENIEVDRDDIHMGDWDAYESAYESVLSSLLSSSLSFSSIYHPVSDEELENNYRLRAASAVTNYLGKEMSYSLLLDDLPVGTDPVEYALTESHEGYCMHFASAATLILRKLDVPARYVSGYVVKPGMFIETKNGYYGEVTDYAAHAWVEIYLNDIGWIPVEVTPGYSDTAVELPSEKDPEELEAQSNTRKDTVEDSEEESQVTGESESLETEDIIEDTEETEEPAEHGNTQPDNEKHSENGTGNGFSGVGKVFGILTCIGIPLFLLISGMKYWKKRYDGLLEREMKKNHTRKAVRRMNRRIYLWLRVQNFGNIKRIPVTGKLSDAEYEKVLCASFLEVSKEDWQEYMRIIRKTHYSKEPVSIEEMMHCYSCYQKVAFRQISLTRF